jgi:hypothetical protein
MHFLAGLPRSGSTLLGTLLCQRPDLQVSATSGLIDIMGAAAAAWNHPRNSNRVIFRLMHSIQC